MGHATIEYADVLLTGTVARTSLSKDGTFTYVNFKGYEGQITVSVPDAVMPSPVLRVGEGVEIACRPGQYPWGLTLTADSVRRLSDGRKPLEAAKV